MIMKYVVYLTVNLLNGKLYVGVYETNPEIFDGFLGEYVYENIPSSYNKRRTPFQYSVAKHGTKNFRRINLKVFESLDEAEAFKESILTDEFLKRPDVYNTGANEYEGEIKVFENKTNNFKGAYSDIRHLCLITESSRKEVEKSLRSKLPLNGYKLVSSYYDSSIIYSYDLDGNFSREYKDIETIKKEFGYCKGKIKRAIKNKKPFKGYYWSYIKCDNILFKPRKAVKVYQYDLEGNFIKEWDTISACKKEYPSVLQVCKGERNHCKNYKFSFNKLKI